MPEPEQMLCWPLNRDKEYIFCCQRSEMCKLRYDFRRWDGWEQIALLREERSGGFDKLRESTRFFCYSGMTCMIWDIGVILRQSILHWTDTHEKNEKRKEVRLFCCERDKMGDLDMALWAIWLRNRSLWWEWSELETSKLRWETKLFC